MWETNSANDCMRLHKIEKSLDIRIRHSASLHSTCGILAHNIYVYSAKVQRFSPPNGR